MRNLMKLTLWGMMYVVGALGLASCSSEDKIAEDENPNYDPITNAVNTQFVFSVSTNDGPITRMTDLNTQANGSNNFRGIEKANVLAYNKGDGHNGEHMFAAATSGKAYNLDRILGAGEITSSDARRVVELSLDLGTNSVMFYGKAIKNETDQQQGKIGYHVDGDGNLSNDNTYFELQPRLEDTGSSSVYVQTKNLLALLLNEVIETALVADPAPSTKDARYAFWWPSKTDATTGEGGERSKIDVFGYEGADKLIAGTSTKEIGGVTNTLYAGTQTWKDYGDNYATLSSNPLAQNLGQLYHSLTSIDNTNEPARSGSAGSIARTIGDLWTIVHKVMIQTTDNPTGAIATTYQEYIAQLLAERINTRLQEYFTSAGTTCTFKSVNNIIRSLETYVDTEASDKYGNITELATFPANLNLPLGSVQLVMNSSTNKFEYRDGANLGAIGDGFDITKIMWPSELCYFGNSPIRTSSSPKVKNDYPATVDGASDKWVADDNSKWSSFEKNSKVVSSTRAVAMQNPINYGTAMLRTTVRYGAAKLKDNNSAIHTTESDNEIDATASAFVLKGILIGGQYRKVGWDYLPINTSTPTEKEFVIYDNDVASGAIPEYDAKVEGSSTVLATSAPVYTIVFDNYIDDTQQQDVLVCLEFQNNSGADFYGKGNLIRDGGTFYLIGRLNLGSQTVTFPDVTYGGETSATSTVPTSAPKHLIPPYDTYGHPKNVTRVFIQDYVTNANFVLNESSLKYAFVTVPDLQASQISFGMSVDLSWSTGPQFNDIPLGQ